MATKISVEEFGAKYKQKYPGRYDGFTNAELGLRMLEAKPVYKDRVEVPSLGKPAQPKKGLASRALEFAGNVATGVAKGELSTVQGLGQLTLKGLEKVTGKDFGSKETFFQDQSALEAKGFAEKLGKGAELVAEFVVPGSAITKTAKGIAGGIRAAEGAGTLARAGAATGRALTKAGIEAAGYGGISALQSGEVGKEAATTAGV